MVIPKSSKTNRRTSLSLLKEKMKPVCLVC